MTVRVTIDWKLLCESSFLASAQMFLSASDLS